MFERDSSEYRRLFGVAYRILGSVHDAEDAVQEGFERWQRLTADERDAIREPMGWLTRVVSRICLDELKSARSRRENYVGIWLPEPLLGEAVSVTLPVTSVDPHDSVSLDESISLALLVAMEQLTPPERVSLILHDVFGMPFGEIGEIVGRTADACRQLATSARRNVRSRPRFDVNGSERDAVVGAFARACMDGNLEALAAVLDPEVISRADGGEHIHAARKALRGANAVAVYLLGVLGQQRNRGAAVVPSLEPVNGRTGIVLREGRSIVAVVDLAVADGAVREIALVVNPEKIDTPLTPHV
ncbi:RNA polymerase sigma factor SigJ [Mycetocola zhadangensis]|uniref:Sigma-70 family RNA polymerase sigma factor n=1 Tax=Mycetocola zhadangensis TaxID=1164595 RepID=A0A3L7J807_9MICO|nr:RNA polymerase sigma factor SigJ [Mycetocola zhadangensis]RLQ86564.1 sigma-70 family RNA polymerase sigma factor [Mycetocola zhadangensis]